jgi:diadenosine tetraphosphatase ApaH/serine/threonine PP2A family protein phosphatase
MKALISDIHANIEALSRVLEDIKARGADEIFCLGDIVGYGASPEECTDAVMDRAKVTILGNHDFALINGPLGFNSIAADIIRLTHNKMLPQDNSYQSNFEPHYYNCVSQGNVPPCMVLQHSKDARWDFFKDLAPTHTVGDVLYVHASPLEPTFEYVFPDIYGNAWKPQRIKLMFDNVERLAFCGHTHYPCAISSDLECLYPPKINNVLQFDPSKKYIINIGSVGQPRDGDSRSCYVLFDPDKNRVEWRRLEYDIDAAAGKIDKLCGPNSFCGLRLRYGK